MSAQQYPNPFLPVDPSTRSSGSPQGAKTCALHVCAEPRAVPLLEYILTSLRRQSKTATFCRFFFSAPNERAGNVNDGKAAVVYVSGSWTTGAFLSSSKAGRDNWNGREPQRSQELIRSQQIHLLERSGKGGEGRIGEECFKEANDKFKLKSLDIQVQDLL